MEKNLLEKNIGLVNQEEDNHLCLTWHVFAEEVKEICYIGGPMVFVNYSTFFLQTITLMMVDQLGKLAQSSTGVAISVCAVTGFSVTFGMASALETLCGQAYGAKQYKKFGVQFQTGTFCVIVCCLPLCVLWLNLGRLLVLLGQDPLVADEAGKFAVCLIPALFGYAILHALIRYYLIQSLITPLILSSSIIICFHIAFCWVMVFKSDLGHFGGAFAIGTSYWLDVMVLALYMKYSDSCKKTQVPISMELFLGIGEYFRFAIPSATMICFHWWSYEASALLSGLLRPNPQLEISILAVWGSGWQNIAAYINFGAYYAFGIPLAAILGFWVHMRAKGLWLGVTTGTLCQVIILLIAVSCTDWKKEEGQQTPKSILMTRESEFAGKIG